MPAVALTGKTAKAGVAKGTLQLAVGPTGKGTSAGGAAGFLTVTSTGGPVALDGKTSSASDLDGILSLGFSLGGIATSASDLDGILGITRGLIGLAVSAATVKGDLTVVSAVPQVSSMAGKGSTAGRAMAALTITRNCSRQPQWQCICVATGLSQLPCLRSQGE